MAVTIKATAYDGVRGAKIEMGTFTIDPASLNAATEAEETFTIDGVATGDLVFVSPQQLTAGLLVKGARVTAADTVGVTLRNELTTSVNGSSVTYSYLIVKFGGDA